MLGLLVWDGWTAGQVSFGVFAEPATSLLFHHALANHNPKSSVQVLGCPNSQVSKPLLQRLVDFMPKVLGEAK